MFVSRSSIPWEGADPRPPLSDTLEGRSPRVAPWSSWPRFPPCAPVGVSGAELVSGRGGLSVTQGDCTRLRVRLTPLEVHLVQRLSRARRRTRVGAAWPLSAGPGTRHAGLSSTQPLGAHARAVTRRTWPVGVRGPAGPANQAPGLSLGNQSDGGAGLGMRALPEVAVRGRLQPQLRLQRCAHLDWTTWRSPGFGGKWRSPEPPSMVSLFPGSPGPSPPSRIAAGPGKRLTFTL